MSKDVSFYTLPKPVSPTDSKFHKQEGRIDFLSNEIHQLKMKLAENEQRYSKLLIRVEELEKSQKETDLST